MAAKVMSIQHCDACGRRDCVGVFWRRHYADGRIAGPVASLCHECVVEGATALASYGNRQVPPAEEI